MYRIVICDDEEIFCRQIHELAAKYTKELEEDTEIESYTGSDEFLKYIDKRADLYFLDIKMPGNTGMELAEVIHSIYPEASVIFVSSLYDAVYESIRYAPFRFIRKEYLDAEIKEAVMAFFSAHTKTDAVIKLRTIEEDIFLPMITIDYVETAGHYLKFHTRGQVCTVRGKLSDYAAFLSAHSIIQVNQSFLVSLRYVSSYHNHKITLENDCEITISRSCRNMFREAYLNYQRSHYHVTVL